MAFRAQDNKVAMWKRSMSRLAGDMASTLRLHLLISVIGALSLFQLGINHIWDKEDYSHQNGESEYVADSPDILLYYLCINLVRYNIKQVIIILLKREQNIKCISETNERFIKNLKQYWYAFQWIFVSCNYYLFVLCFNHIINWSGYYNNFPEEDDNHYYL